MSGGCDPKVDLCPSCGRRMLKLYAMRGLGIKKGRLPTAYDDASWAELDKDHEEGCQWWATRAFRRVG
jgi:hypothetical protein